MGTDTGGRNRFALRRRGFAVLGAALLLAGCGDTEAPGTRGGGGSGGSDGSGVTNLPAPYGEQLTMSGSADGLCGTETRMTADMYIDWPGTTGPSGGGRGEQDTERGPVQVGARLPDEAGAVPAASAQAHPARSAAPSPRSRIMPDEGIVEEVGVEVVSDPGDPVLRLEITLTGPERDDPYLTESLSVSFLTTDDDQRWVGFAAHDGELTQRLPLDEPIAPSPEGTTTTVEVVPVACPDGDATSFTADPLADGSYDLSIFGSLAPAEEPEDGRTGHAMWGQDHTRVTVTGGVVDGAGYDGPNSYGN
ncbi:hypothetical protein ACPYO6_08305 [Georgenia sp. Z1344]|uniref:hypothetical protein n=1 Tax=Georgenia sp. Z1344 TaxID=3416706 RepID=UPI003CE6B9D8